MFSCRFRKIFVNTFLIQHVRPTPPTFIFWPMTKYCGSTPVFGPTTKFYGTMPPTTLTPKFDPCHAYSHTATLPTPPMHPCYPYHPHYLAVSSHSFWRKSRFESHNKVCENKHYCNAIIPSENNKILEFKHYLKSDW